MVESKESWLGKVAVGEEGCDVTWVLGVPAEECLWRDEDLELMVEDLELEWFATGDEGISAGGFEGLFPILLCTYIDSQSERVFV